MVKRTVLLVLTALLLAGQTAKNVRVITITASTPQRIVGTRQIANSILIQVNPGAAGAVYVLSAPVGATCSASSHKVATLAPGSGDDPGMAYSEDLTQNPTGFDVQTFCLDGANNGDTVQVSWIPRN